MQGSMQERVFDIITRQRLIAADDKVLIAVSGGVDSVVLLHILHALAPRLPFTLFAAHLDHSMRPESGADAAFVAELCERLNVSLFSEKVDVPALASERGQGPEEAGRFARRELLRRVAQDKGCEAIALGHHRDDQAETVLHRLLRGSSASGLAGMRVRHDEFIRPLLTFSRQEVESYATDHQLMWREDESNSDTCFTRNRIRHELLPQLREYNPRIEENLTGLAERLALEEDFWSGLVEYHFVALVLDQSDGLRLSVEGLLALHPALRSRVLRHALHQVRESAMGVTANQIESLNRLLVGETQAEAHLSGVWAARRYDALWLRCASPQVEGFELTVDEPGTVELPGGGAFTFSYDPPQGENQYCAEFDPEHVSFPLVIRTIRVGDRFRPAGGSGTRKLKDVFIDAKVEHEKRRTWPLLVGEEILWIPGLRRGESGRVAAETKKVLRVVFTPGFRHD